MWKEKISLNEAVDLSYNAKYEERRGKGRWTETMWYVIDWSNSPTGYAGFSYDHPNSNESLGIFDVNSENVELVAVTPVEVTKIEWKTYNDE